MQLQGFLIMLFVLVIAPVVILSSNHNLFFVVMSGILLTTSIKNIYLALAGVKKEIPVKDEEFIDEMEGMTGVDMKKLGAGTRIVKKLIIVLFFIYCSFYLKPMVFKVLLSAIILYQLHEIKEIARQGSGPEEKSKGQSGKFLTLSVNVSRIITILSTFYIKLFNG